MGGLEMKIEHKYLNFNGSPIFFTTFLYSVPNKRLDYEYQQFLPIVCVTK